MPLPPRVPPSEIVVRSLRGSPEAGFDCGREEQTRFLYEYALPDQEAQLSVTNLYYVHGILAAFSAACMDAIPLGRQERDPAVRYQSVPALKLAQLGVHLPFQGSGLGQMVVSDVVELARDEATRVGCRYVTLDAHPDLVGWYEKRGFKRNLLRQDQRIHEASRHGRDPAVIAVSMRYDLRR